MNYIKKTQRLMYFGFFTTIFNGCTEPIAPIAGPAGNSMIVYILLFIVLYLLWYIYTNRQNSSLNSRLTKIEEELKNLKSEIKGKNHDK